MKLWLIALLKRWFPWCLAALAVSLALIIFAIFGWDWLRSGGSGPAESNGTTLRNIGLMVAGVIALPLALWRSLVAERQAKTAQEQLVITQRSLRQDRYQRGAEMLGNALLSARLGGIYALQRLAADYHNEYHIQVMELFCAFVRNPIGQQGEVSVDVRDDGDPPLREDVQAVISAIGERSDIGKELERERNFELDLHGAHLTRVNIDRADLQYANLSDATLVYATCEGTSFRDAYLHEANLAGAFCQGTRFDRAKINGAQMNNIEADFAVFTQAFLLNVDFSHALLNSVDFSEAHFFNINLTGTTIGTVPHQPNLVCLLTQDQLDRCWSNPGIPPRIAELTVDRETGEPLVWSDRSSPEPNSHRL